jgi:D-3-phosphoglycerate dehydrogenase
MSKVAVTDYTFPDLQIEASIIEAAGGRIESFKQKRSPEELIPLVADADQVIAQFASINADVIQAMQKARVIVRYGIGVDNVDLEAARRRNIPVCNVPDYCIHEVADHTLGFILGATRQVVSATNSIRAGEWKLPSALDQMRTLCDLTIGIIGFGRIGREVVQRLKAFRARVLVFDPVVPTATIESAGCIPASLAQVYAESDVLSLHCPSTAQTRGLIGREALTQMKPGALLVNVARGDLVDPDALTEALRSGHLSGAALDVFSPEPIPANHPILKMENVIVSAHIASASVRAVRRLRETVAQIAAASIRNQPLPYVVNGVK